MNILVSLVPRVCCSLHTKIKTVLLAAIRWAYPFLQIITNVPLLSVSAVAILKSASDAILALMPDYGRFSKFLRKIKAKSCLINILRTLENFRKIPQSTNTGIYNLLRTSAKNAGEKYSFFKRKHYAKISSRYAIQNFGAIQMCKQTYLHLLGDW